MDYVSNEHPTGGFFGGGYESAFQAIRLDSDKNQATGSDLGIITNLQVSRTGGDFQKNDLEKSKILAERFLLQEIACSILFERTTYEKDGDEYSKYVWRVNNCLKLRVDASKPVTVRYNEFRKKAHYDNLQRCARVWTCPFCALKISEERRKEIKTAMDNARAKGWFVYLFTFTNRHHCGDDLEVLVEGQKGALVDFWQKSKVKKMMKDLGYVGRITATEVTWSPVNGWHPHYHMLVFFDHEINTQGLQSFLSYDWQKSCGRVGLKLPSLERGVKVDKGDKADEYVAKWGLEHEMTKGHIKKGREDGLTPFDLLRQSVEHPKYRALFRQYAVCFQEINQLRWSKGLKALLGVANRTDEELAQETEKESIQIDEVATQIWRLVVRYKIRFEYLQAVELDYLEGGIFNRVNNLVLGYAEIEQKRLNALDSG